MDRFTLDPAYLSGEKLHGNDFDADQLRAWYEAEEYGYYQLYRGEGELAEKVFPYRAINRADGTALRDRHYSIGLVLGCAEGEDLKTLELDLGQIIAIEPADQCWAEKIGGVPAEYRKPTLNGTIDLADRSVDLVVCLSVLHHVANVEFVVSELGRVLKSGGAMLVREPISSMGDFRAPRQGLTRFERGIPAAMMRQFIECAGLKVQSQTYRNTPGIPEFAKKLGVTAFNIPLLVTLDQLISAIFRFNDRYWRPSFLSKLAPRQVTFIARKN